MINNKLTTKFSEIMHLYCGCFMKKPNKKYRLILDGYVLSNNIITTEKPILNNLSDLNETDALNLFKLISLYDLSDCIFKFIKQDENSPHWLIEAYYEGKKVDCLEFDGNIFTVMTNNGEMCVLNPQSPGLNWLRLNFYDLDNLIVSGQAIDAKTYTNN